MNNKKPMSLGKKSVSPNKHKGHPLDHDPLAKLKGQRVLIATTDPKKSEIEGTIVTVHTYFIEVDGAEPQGFILVNKAHIIMVEVL